MSTINMKLFGLNLSGRPLGIQVFKIISKDHDPIYELDFEGVISIGSSFADEVVAKLAKKNGGEIKILNSSRIIDKCLKEVSRDMNFELVY